MLISDGGEDYEKPNEFLFNKLKQILIRDNIHLIIVGYTYDVKRIHFLQRMVALTNEGIYIDIEHADTASFDKLFQELSEPQMGKNLLSLVILTYLRTQLTS